MRGNASDCAPKTYNHSTGYAYTYRHNKYAKEEEGVRREKSEEGVRREKSEEGVRREKKEGGGRRRRE